MSIYYPDLEEIKDLEQKLAELIEQNNKLVKALRVYIDWPDQSGDSIARRALTANKEFMESN